MENISPFFLLSAGIFIFIIFGILVFLLIGKSEQVGQLVRSLTKMKKSFNELDEQAKLIVKTDLELNRVHEESERRLKGLDALQKTSRLISTTLDEKEILNRIGKSLMTELGFERSLILIYDNNKELQGRVNFGFSAEELPVIISNLAKEKDLLSTLIEGNTLSSVTAPKQRIETINSLFDVEHFVLSPILTQNDCTGMVFVGNQSNALPVTEGDEELISILANQIGQSLENARLFEQVFSSGQLLEVKIQDRTKQLASALEEVKKISQTKSEFISAVSHELRTPLTSIKGYASLLMTGKLGDIPDKVKERLEKVNTHSDNLVKLINDLLDISRIESGRVEMKMGKCHLDKIVDNIQDLLTPQIKDKNILFKSDIAKNIPELLLDSSQIERVFINLISNAVKFTPEKGTIGVKIQPNKDVINIEVSDTGIGIPEEDIVKLFDEFYRVDNQINASVKGTGLGLALAKKIVEAHNGRIWITSMVNEGTTFHFTLPLPK